MSEISLNPDYLFIHHSDFINANQDEIKKINEELGFLSADLCYLKADQNERIMNQNKQINESKLLFKFEEANFKNFNGLVFRINGLIKLDVVHELLEQLRFMSILKWNTIRTTKYFAGEDVDILYLELKDLIVDVPPEI